MYITRNTNAVVPGKTLEAEAAARRIYDQVKGQKGFDRGGFGVSYGNLGRYLGLSVWKSREEAQAYFRGAASQSLLREIAPLISPVQPAHAYEEVHAVVDAPPGGAGCIVVIDLTAAPGKAAALEASVKEAYALRKRHGKGFITNRLCRSLSSPNRYLSYWVHTSRDDALATVNAPAVQKYMQAHPVTDFTVGSVIDASDFFELLHVVTGG